MRYNLGHKQRRRLLIVVEEVDDMAAFKDGLPSYKTLKGVMPFVYNKTIPFDLVVEAARFRTRQTEENRL